MIRRPPRSHLFPYPTPFRSLDISSESAATRRLYGLDEPATAEYGARCLIARRLVERGVRFVRSEDHTSELQPPDNLLCRLLLQNKSQTTTSVATSLYYLPFF